jgi:hypothetical protein
MKNMRVIGKFGLLLSFVCLTATMTYATTYTFVGDGKWDNPNNWDANGVPPNPLTAGNEIIINPPANAYGIVGQPILNIAFEIESGASLRIFPVAGAERALRMESGGLVNSGTVTVNGTLSVSDDSTFINQGTLILGDKSKVNTKGTFNNGADGVISVVSGGVLRIEGNLTNQGRLENKSGGTVETVADATLDNQGTFDNRGTFNNYGTLKGNAPATPQP